MLDKSKLLYFENFIDLLDEKSKSALLDVIDMNKKEMVEAVHKYKISQLTGKDQRWHTYIPADTKRGIKEIKKNTEKEIIDYIKQAKIIKIATTYDSLPKVIAAYNQATGKDAFKDLFLLVDEAHVLTNQYVFRNSAIKRLLESSMKFERKTFLTATPVDEEFQLKELEGLPLVKVEWADTPQIKIIPYKTNKPARLVQDLVEDAMQGKVFGNLHFFLNSVEMIGNIIRNTSLASDMVRIVCANSKENEDKLGKGFKIEKTTAPVKKSISILPLHLKGATSMTRKEGCIS